MRKAIDEQSSSALHLGTYAAAVENMMRRTHDEPTPISPVTGSTKSRSHFSLETYSPMSVASCPGGSARCT